MVLIYLLLSFVGCSSLTEDKYEEVMKYCVKAVQYSTSEFWCFGGIVSVNSVITSCRCIGSYRPPDMYEFTTKNLDDLVIKTQNHDVFRIRRWFTHNLCRPSTWNYTANDIGGWQIRGSFDLTTVAIAPPVFTKKVSMRDVLDCHIPAYDIKTERYNIVAVEIFEDQKKCVDCAVMNVDRPFDCDTYKTNLVNSGVNCARITPDSGEVKGAPLICHVVKENTTGKVLIGVLSFSSSNIAFWTSVDMDTNRQFFIDVMRGRSVRIDLSIPSLITVLLNHMIRIFNKNAF